MSELKGWFFASLVFATSNGSGDTGVVRQYNILVWAVDPDEALTKAQAMGANRSSDVENFLGVQELLSIDGEVQDGVELVWCEELWV